MENAGKELTEVEKPILPTVVGGSLFLDVRRFEHAQRVAQMLVTSTMIPEHFQNNLGNCLIALNLAERFMADPFMVMQNVYVVHGKPGLEGKLVIALLNQCGKFSPIQYKFDRDKNGKTTACTAYATHKETGEKLEQTVTWDMVHAEGWDSKKGSKWLTMPDLMFQYRSATFFARVFCPEVILGMQTTDEIFDFTDMHKGAGGTYSVDEKPASDLTETIQKKTAEQNNVETEDESPPTIEAAEPTIDETEDSDMEPEKVEEETMTPAIIADKWLRFRNEWIRLQGPGFSTYFYKNRELFESAPVEIQKEARTKWHKLYPGTPYPLDDDNETDSAADEETAIDLTKYNDEELGRIHARIAVIDQKTEAAVGQETGLTWGACRHYSEMAREFLLACFQEYRRAGKDPAVFIPSKKNGSKGEDLA